MASLLLQPVEVGNKLLDRFTVDWPGSAFTLSHRVGRSFERRFSNAVKRCFVVSPMASATRV